MCKSELNACFTKVLDPLNTNSPLTHGCVDSLLNSADVCSSKNVDVSGGSSSPVECCHDDMCNYRGLHDLTHPRGDSTGEIHKCARNESHLSRLYHMFVSHFIKKMRKFSSSYLFKTARLSFFYGA